MSRPCAAIACATESTRNGMSSLITASRIRRSPSMVRPEDSSRSAGSPGALREAVSAMKSTIRSIS